MCIMEVRAGQRSDTIAQACAHNVSTVERDCDMFAKVLEARKDKERLTALLRAQDNLKRAYADLLDIFGEEVALTEMDPAGHVHTAGNERSFTEQAHHDAQLARTFETR